MIDNTPIIKILSAYSFELIGSTKLMYAIHIVIILAVLLLLISIIFSNKVAITELIE